MKTTEKKGFAPKFLTEKESMERLKKSRPDLFQALKNPSPKSRVGANVMALRYKKGFSQKELADKAKVGFRTLQRIEEAQPTSNPTSDVLEGLALALGVDIVDLYKPVDLIKTYSK